LRGVERRKEEDWGEGKGEGETGGLRRLRGGKRRIGGL
jgi:hypothetical protein